jgi:hypothetical protein
MGVNSEGNLQGKFKLYNYREEGSINDVKFFPWNTSSQTEGS